MKEHWNGTGLLGQTWQSIFFINKQWKAMGWNDESRYTLGNLNEQVWTYDIHVGCYLSDYEPVALQIRVDYQSVLPCVNLG
ncbi:hypothetical protein CEXT_547541 [Caerostris extrusa]|uniref:Uncharacterized protein n=1 Tax=Caerostris extrusa TaxID=172846 RepID=A0AAV4XJU2_CAEEX|nr:hypothetical protein CEXT_547541 [Caerostris extrusa]